MQKIVVKIIEVRIGSISDLDQIIQLNRKYLASNLSDSEKCHGFIRIEYNRLHLMKIIESKEIVVAVDMDCVIGYYLIGRTSGNRDI